MNFRFGKSALVVILTLAGYAAWANTPPDDGVQDSMNVSEAGSSDVAYCTTGKCFNQVNVNLLTGNRYQEAMKVMNISDPNQPLPRQETATSTK